MNIVIFGLTVSSSWGNGHATPYRAILRALRKMGHRITFYEKDVPYYAAHRDFRKSDFCDLVLYKDWSSIRDRALRQVRETDAVIHASYCPDGATIIDDVATAAPALHVFYDLDTPITLAKMRTGPLEYLRNDQIPGFDLFLSFTGGRILCELEHDWGARRARPLYGCVDPYVYRRTRSQEQFACLLSYMGTYALDRQPKLEEFFLTPACVLPGRDFVLAGPMYPWEWNWPENVKRFDHVGSSEHPALYSSSQFTLNITRSEMSQSGYCPSGRFFEAAACGTPILSDWFEGLDLFFEPGEEIIIVEGTEQVLDALQCSDTERLELAHRARERTLEEHTGERRAEQLIGYLREVTTWKRARSRGVEMEAAS